MGKQIIILIIGATYSDIPVLSTHKYNNISLKINPVNPYDKYERKSSDNTVFPVSFFSLNT